MKRRQKNKSGIRKILIATRGEIAVRVIRACRELDIPNVAAYCDPDRNSLHVQLADEAVGIGGVSGYLDVDAVVGAARDTGCDAVHPGYGFLAENHRLAAALEDAGIVFVGPTSDVVRAMGSKIESRRLMREAGVPIVPGTVEGSDDVDAIVRAAEEFEGPIFLKASAGGGGKGMRLVEDRSKLADAARAAVGEAKSAFGDPTVYIEECLDRPRHIEFQLLADHHGNVVHLFERECSIQRRHQKLLEEAPSCHLSADLRARMGETAVRAARAVGYRNAGTVEFMLTPDGDFYFLEMNTRIQVEHPVTELITGIDLVKWQIRIAGGEQLGFRQEDIAPRGHAIECRIYAEDPWNHFLPSCGVIDYLREPRGPGIRNDSGVYEGWEVTPYFDPILSKLITHAEDREGARRRMLEALEEYVVHGIHTTVEVHKQILSSPAFVAGETDTAFLDAHIHEWFEQDRSVGDEAFIAAALAEELMVRPVGVPGEGRTSMPSPWQTLGRWRIGEAR